MTAIKAILALTIIILPFGLVLVLAGVFIRKSMHKHKYRVDNGYTRTENSGAES